MNKNIEKVDFRYIELKVTRRCNMNCLHCYCGEPQDINMTPDIIDSFLQQVNSIDKLRITGGEPFLNLDILKYLYDQLVKRNMIIGSIGIISNGKIYNQEIVELLEKYFNLSLNKDKCYLAITTDKYHEKSKMIDNNIEEYMKTLKFEVFKNTPADDGIQFTGRADNESFKTPYKQNNHIATNGSVKIYFPVEIEQEGHFIKSQIGLSSKGYYYHEKSGLWSYEMEDYDNYKHAISNVYSETLIKDFQEWNEKPSVDKVRKTLFYGEKLCKLIGTQNIKNSDSLKEIDEVDITQFQTCLNDYIKAVDDLSNDTDCNNPFTKDTINEIAIVAERMKTYDPLIVKNSIISLANNKVSKLPSLKEAFPSLSDDVISGLFEDIEKNNKLFDLAQTEQEKEKVESDKRKILEVAYKLNLYYWIEKELSYLTEDEIRFCCQSLDNALNSEDNPLQQQTYMQYLHSMEQVNNDRKEFEGLEDVHKQYPRLSRKECLMMSNSKKQLADKKGIAYQDKEIRQRHINIIKKLEAKT